MKVVSYQCDAGIVDHHIYVGACWRNGKTFGGAMTWPAVIYFENPDLKQMFISQFTNGAEIQKSQKIFCKDVAFPAAPLCSYSFCKMFCAQEIARLHNFINFNLISSISSHLQSCIMVQKPKCTDF